MRRLVLPLAAALALAGCSDGDEIPAENAAATWIHLSDANRDGNAATIAAFFNRTCLQAGESAGSLSSALVGSGWEHDQVQSASAIMPIAGWRLERADLVHATMTLGANSHFIDCELILDTEVAPAVERMRDAIRPLLPRAALREVSAGPPEARWEWQADLREERVLTIGPPARRDQRGRLSLHLRITEITPVEAPPADTNATEGAELPNATEGAEVGNAH